MKRSLWAANARASSMLKAAVLCCLPLIVFGFATRFVVHVSAAPQARVSAKSVSLFAPATQAPETVITSTSGAYVDEPCLIIAPTGNSVVSVETRLFVPLFTGSPVSASLVITSCGVSPGERHSIYVNGERIGGVKENSGTTCFCGSGRTDSYAVTPTLVISGWNVISITNDANVRKGWTAYAPKLVIEGELRSATLGEFSTGTKRWASYQLPLDYAPGESRPLLVVVGATFGDEYHGVTKEYRQRALLRFSERANQRGWLLLAPAVRECEQREVETGDYRGGGRTASILTQHDFINAIDYMKAHYGADPERVYMSGFSSGGAVVTEMAAKYPDVFAAVVDWAGFNDILEYVTEGQRIDLKSTMIHLDFGCWVQGDPTDPCGPQWKSRSAREVSMNLRHVPMAVIHGRADEEVPIHQSEQFYNAMARDYVPEEHNKLFLYHDGGTLDTLPDFDELEWMSQFRLNACPTEFKIRSDEDKTYYWVTFHQKTWNGNTGYIYSQVEASYDPETKVISATIQDQRAKLGGNLPLDVDLHLDRIAACFPGLDPAASYTVEDYNPSTGDYVLQRDVVPQAGRLTVSLGRDASGYVLHQFLIYPFSAPALMTATLQQGVGPTVDYLGVADTYVDNESRASNYAGSSELQLTYNGSKSALLEFDLSPIPANAQVKSAHLTMYLTQDRPNMDVSLYGILVPWAVTQTNWLQAAEGRPWAAGGVSGEDVDYAAPAVGLMKVGTRGFYVFHLRDTVDSWLSGNNQGLLIAGPRQGGSGSTFYRFASSDTSAASQRPRLVVEYMLPAVMPTATASATPTASPSASPSPTPSRTPTASATLSASETATQAPTTTQTPTGLPTATPTPTASPSATPTASPTATWQSTPTSTPTATPVGATCLRWDNAWHDEFEDPALALWEADWGQGAGVMQDSALCLKADNGNSNHFPVLWTQPGFPQGSYVLQIRFRYGPPTRYGTTILVGSAAYNGERYNEGEQAPEDTGDVLSIEQSSVLFRISLFGLVEWLGPIPDTRWHVVQVAREGSIYTLSVDDQYIGAVSREDKLPTGLLMGNPTVMYYPGPWTLLYVDYIRVATCGLLGNKHVWLPLMIEPAP